MEDLVINELGAKSALLFSLGRPIAPVTAEDSITVEKDLDSGSQLPHVKTLGTALVYIATDRKSVDLLITDDVKVNTLADLEAVYKETNVTWFVFTRTMGMINYSFFKKGFKAALTAEQFCGLLKSYTGYNTYYHRHEAKVYILVEKV